MYSSFFFFITLNSFQTLKYPSKQITKIKIN